MSAQVDTRAITEGADREGHGGVVVHPEQVASYLAKYLTKATEDFGLPARVLSAAHARAIGASQHAVRIIAAGERIASENEAYGLLLSHLGTLGYRGHPITKSRAYSVTFTQIRRARRRYRANPAGLAPDADIRVLLDDDLDVPEGFELVSSWVFLGQGYLDLDQVNHTLQRVGGVLRFQPPKTRHSRRTIPLPAPCLEALRAHRVAQGKERLAAGGVWFDMGMVFTTAIGTPIEPDNLRRSWYVARKVLGDPPPRFHDLRHTCVSLLLAEGAPPHVVQQIVGHSAIDVTMTIYAHASLEEKRTALGRLGERLA